MSRILKNLGLETLEKQDKVKIEPTDIYFKSMAELFASIQKIKGNAGNDGKNGKAGRDGKDGYTPIKGKDYYTPEEIKDIKESIKPIKGVDYVDGRDGKDGADGKDGINGITEIIEKKAPLTVADIELIASQLEKLPEGKKMGIDAIRDWRIEVAKLISKGTRAGVYNTGGDSGEDVNAIHTNQANEISGLTEKVTPANNDLIVIEDSADGFNKKKVKISSLPSGSGGAVSSVIAGDGISVDGNTGNVTVTNDDKGSSAVATHVGLSDPHTQYIKKELAIAYSIAL